MPAIGNVVINDGATTPLAHTFGPAGIDGLVAGYADRSGGIPVGYYSLDVSLRKPSPKSIEKMYLATFRIKTPILEQTSPSTSTGIQPAPTVGYTPIAELKFWLPERSALQDRKNLRAFVKNLLADAVVTAVVETLESVY
jgi:hypothetical protein